MKKSNMEYTEKKIEGLTKCVKFIEQEQLKLTPNEKLLTFKIALVNKCFNNFENGNNVIYLIGDFYIGKTNNTLNKCYSHIRDAILNIPTNSETNKIFIDKIKYGKIDFKILSDNIDDKKKLILEHIENNYKLTNVKYNKLKPNTIINKQN